MPVSRGRIEFHDSHESFRFTADEQPGAAVPLGARRWFHLELEADVGQPASFKTTSLWGEFENGDGGRAYTFRLVKEDDFGSDSYAEAVKEIARCTVAPDKQSTVTSYVAKLIWHEGPDECRCRHDDLQEFKGAVLVGTYYMMYSFNLYNFFRPAAAAQSDNDRTDCDETVNLVEAAAAGESQAEQEKRDRLIRNYLDHLFAPTQNGEAARRKGSGAAGKKKKVGRFKVSDARERELKVIRDGHSFSVFRGRLKGWLVDETYKLETDATDAPDTSYYIRLSKTGLVEIRKERKLSERFNPADDRRTHDAREDAKRAGGERMIDVLNELIRHRSISPRPASAVSDEDEVVDIAERFARRFAKKLNAHLKHHPPAADEWPRERNFTARRSNDPPRQRYVAILLSDIRCRSRRPAHSWAGGDGRYCNRTILPGKIHNNVSLVLSLLGGTIVYDEKLPDTLIPAAPRRIDRLVFDKSTWKDELCVFGPERCLIYFQPKTVLESKDSVSNYEDYWRCIVRGIEHTVSVRTALRILETKTERFMDEIPGLMTDVFRYKPSDTGDKERFDETARKVEDLAQRVAEALRVVPKLRDICVSTSAFRSGHAVEKFTYLNNECFRFPDTLNHIQQNIDELTNFLTFFKQQQLQLTIDQARQESEESNSDLNLYGLLIAVGAVFYATASAIKDTNEFIEARCFALGADCVMNWTASLSVTIYVGFLFVVGYMLRKRPRVKDARERLKAWWREHTPPDA